MNQHATRPTADENCTWVRELVDRCGLTEKVNRRLSALLERLMADMDGPPARETWDSHWAKAYSYGHNVLHLQDRRLAHFAHAYADICEEVDALVPDLEMTLEAFWLRWDAGDSFEGTENEDWHLVPR